MGLQQFERRLERLVEGVFAKAFRSGLQPLELGRRMAREMDLARSVAVRGVIAPNAFSIELSPEDLERFATFSETLVRDLADLARGHAKDQGYLLLGPVEVTLAAGDRAPGSFEVAAAVVEGDIGATGELILQSGARIPVTDGAVSIGRNRDCEVSLTDPSVSRRHAEVRRQSEGFVIVDLGSRNGTRVNGAGIRERVLNDGDEISVGDTTMRFESR